MLPVMVPGPLERIPMLTSFPAPSSVTPLRLNVFPAFTRNHPRASPEPPVFAEGVMMTVFLSAPTTDTFVLTTTCGPSTYVPAAMFTVPPAPTRPRAS